MKSKLEKNSKPPTVKLSELDRPFLVYGIAQMCIYIVVNQNLTVSSVDLLVPVYSFNEPDGYNPPAIQITQDQLDDPHKYRLATESVTLSNS